MKSNRWTLLLVGLVFGSVTLWAERDVPLSNKMSDAAQAFLGSLSPELKKKAQFTFEDPQRLKWFFTPQQEKKVPTRKGVRMDELSPEQKKLALELLKTGTSKTGFEQATTIMSLEGILRDLEKGGAIVRNPDWYFVSFFGEPSKTGTWSWRIEGHHLSVNITIDRGQVSSVTPFLFASNPAEVKSGDKKGLRTLPEIEDLARQLIQSLSEQQKKQSQQAKHLPEVAEGIPAAKPGTPIGLSADQLKEGQRATLMNLLQAYTNRMPEQIGELEFNNVKKTESKQIFFAYSGETQPGKPYTYRVHGPSFLVEFLNVQADGSGNPANHIHSVWRSLPTDFATNK